MGFRTRMGREDGQQFPLLPRLLRRFQRDAPQHRSFGFHIKQRPPIFDQRGEDHEGRIRAVILRRDLRGQLGRRPTAKEYRAAKKAARVSA